MRSMSALGLQQGKCAKMLQMDIQLPTILISWCKFWNQYPTSSDPIQWECSFHCIPKQWTALQCHVHPSTARLTGAHQLQPAHLFTWFSKVPQVIDQMARLKATWVPLARFQVPIVTTGVKTMEYHTNLQQAARDDPLIPDCQNYVMCIPESVSCLKASLQSNCSGSLNRNDQRIQLIWSNQDMLTTDNHSLFSVPLLILTHKLSKTSSPCFTKPSVPCHLYFQGPSGSGEQLSQEVNSFRCRAKPKTCIWKAGLVQIRPRLALP